MKHNETNNLLKEVFRDEELESLREKSLTRGLSAVRARRRGRALRMAAMGVVPVLLIGVIWLRVGPNASLSPPVVAVPAWSDVRRSEVKIYPAFSMADAPPVTIISDKELFALFKDRSVGLVGEPGRQSLVFYDQPDAVR